MSYQFGDRDDFFKQVSGNVSKAKEEIREREEGQTMRYEDKRSKMVDSLEKMKKHYNTKVVPEIPRVRERKQMAKEDMEANLIREAENIILEKQRLIDQARRDLENRKGMINEDYLANIVRLNQRNKDKEINSKLVIFLGRMGEIDSKDPRGERKLYDIAMEQKTYLDNLLKENKMTPEMRQKINKYMHTDLRELLSR